MTFQSVLEAKERIIFQEHPQSKRPFLVNMLVIDPNCHSKENIISSYQFGKIKMMCILHTLNLINKVLLE